MSASVILRAAMRARVPRIARSIHASRLRMHIPKADEMLEKFAEGDRARLAHKRGEMMAKYQDKLQAKVAEHGYKSVDDLAHATKKVASEQQVRETAMKAASSPVEHRDAALRLKLQEKRRKNEQAKLDREQDVSSPVQPLSTFMKLEKIVHESPENIGKLWTAFHIMKNKISAVVPAATYAQMVDTAKSFPQFVLPLPRIVKKADEDGEAESGYEVYYLQWIPLPKPADTASNAPAPMAVLFTPLAEYKLRQEYAQPTLVLTHYTDLIESKGIVLLRGDITESDKGKAHIQQKDAQLLTLGLQRFYHIDWALEGLDNDEQVDRRRALLRAFHERPTEFRLEELIDASWKI